MPQDHQFVKCARYAMACSWIVLIIGVGVVVCASNPSFLYSRQTPITEKPSRKNLLTAWSPPDSTSIPNTAEGKIILYGRELVSHTAIYLGPKGIVKATSNGMNCQNCH